MDKIEEEKVSEFDGNRSITVTQSTSHQCPEPNDHPLLFFVELTIFIVMRPDKKFFIGAAIIWMKQSNSRKKMKLSSLHTSLF